MSPESRTPRQQVQLWISEAASAIEGGNPVKTSPSTKDRERRQPSPRMHHNRSVERGKSKGKASSMSYLPGLDGLRAIAVIAVLLYHAGLAWIPGGFLGVEVFFVISGFLITALLLSEWRSRGTIDLKAFWMRRARRLLPALYVLLAATLTFAVLFLPEEVARLRNEALAAFGYVTNWYLIFNQESYFEAAGRPSMFLHLWSLAVEEQFYLIWPALLVAGMTFFRRRTVLAYILGGALLSALLMAVLYHPDVDPSRIYYGTDTRASGLLTGAALAFLWVPEMLKRGPAGVSEDRRHGLRKDRHRHLRHRWGWAIPRLLDMVGLLSLGILVVFFLRVNEFEPFLYRGGMALVGLTTALTILIVVNPRAQLGTKLLEWKPLRWVGLRSYSIYLWHWPVFMVTRPQLDVSFDGVPLLIFRLAASVFLAHLSYKYVEVPIRRGALERAWNSLRESRGHRRLQLGLRWAGALATGLIFSAALGLALFTAQPQSQPDYVSSKQLHKGGELAQSPTGESSKAPGGAESGRGSEPSQQQDDSVAGAASSPDAASPADGSGVIQNPSVSAIGDSVMLGASANLEQKIGSVGVVETIDAEIGFQVQDVISILGQRQAAGQLGNVVVVHVGNNGPVSAEEFDEIMNILSGSRKVVFVNVKVPRRWEGPNNEVLAEGVGRYPNAVLVDWHGFSQERPQLFWDDGMHLRPEGAQAYTSLILQAIKTGS